jgi:hypothetical protein
MIKNLEFFGCSVTAGNELWEEAHLPNYKKMTFDEARKVANTHPYTELRPYNIANGFPALTAKALGVDFKNHGIPGIANKEIAARAIAAFPEDMYKEGSTVFLQLTTHNRAFIRYKETKKESLLGSFVIHPSANDDRLTKSQNNLIKESFLEFYNETLLSLDDHIFMYYAIEVLRNKGIDAHILWCDTDVIDWASWDNTSHAHVSEKDVPLKTDTDPQYLPNLSRHIAGSHIKYNPLGTTLNKIVGEDSRLPRWHYTKNAHIAIADALTKRLKNV